MKVNEPLISVESMKMEFLIRATHEVRIKEIRSEEGRFVQKGDQLIIFEGEEKKEDGAADVGLLGAGSTALDEQLDPLLAEGQEYLAGDGDEDACCAKDE